MNNMGEKNRENINEKNSKIIFVTGYFGAPTEEMARQIASNKGFKLVDLDSEIEKRDGRSIKRLVMMNGEHGYRNLEYELLGELCSDATKPSTEAGNLVILCGDGVLHDDDSRSIISQGELVIVGGDMSADELWDFAKAKTDSYHAFMSFGTEDEKRASFDALIERQRALFAAYF